MSFYTSIQNGSRQVLAVGPFRRHGSALAALERTRRYVAEHERDGRGHFYAYGTARDAAGHGPGPLNERLGLPADGSWLDEVLR